MEERDCEEGRLTITRLNWDYRKGIHMFFNKNADSWRFYRKGISSKTLELLLIKKRVLRSKNRVYILEL